MVFPCLFALLWVIVISFDAEMPSRRHPRALRRGGSGLFCVSLPVQVMEKPRGGMFSPHHYICHCMGRELARLPCPPRPVGHAAGSRQQEKEFSMQ